MSASNVDIKSIVDGFRLAWAIGVPMGLGFFAAAPARAHSARHFADLKHASFEPGRGIYRPAWAAVFATIGYASFLVYKTGRDNNISTTRPFFYYLLQFVFALLFCNLLFKERKIFLALVIVFTNACLVGITAFEFYSIKPEAGYLLVPYMGWLLWLGLLTKNLWRLNMEKDSTFHFHKTLVSKVTKTN
jgi:tryptophan-rich sensory protein